MNPCDGTGDCNFSPCPHEGLTLAESREILREGLDGLNSGRSFTIHPNGDLHDALANLLDTTEGLD